MIIDLILDRRDGMKCGKDEYSPHDFYMRCMAYGEIAEDITHALDGGSEHDAKRELIKYVTENNYSLDIIDFILSVWWIDRNDHARIKGIIEDNRIS